MACEHDRFPNHTDDLKAAIRGFKERHADAEVIDSVGLATLVVESASAPPPREKTSKRPARSQPRPSVHTKPGAVDGAAEGRGNTGATRGEVPEGAYRPTYAAFRNDLAGALELMDADQFAPFDQEQVRNWLPKVKRYSF